MHKIRNSGQKLVWAVSDIFRDWNYSCALCSGGIMDQMGLLMHVLQLARCHKEVSLALAVTAASPSPGGG